MNLPEYDTMFHHEDRHWWFVGTRAVILDRVRRLLASHAPEASRPRLLDVGCGTGATLSAVSGEYAVHGVELARSGAQYCLRRGLRRVGRARAEHLPFQDGAFDLVMALDVVEHIEDDAAALGEIVRVTRVGGSVLLTVPAHPFLWSRHDEALHHVRRYRRGEFKELIESSGLQIEQLSYYNASFFVPIAVVRLAQRFLGRFFPQETPSSDVAMPNRLINWLFSRLLSQERWFLRWMSLPFGVSLIAQCRRPQA